MSITTHTIFIYFYFFTFPFKKLNRLKLRWACMHISWSLFCLVAENDFELSWRRALMHERRTVICISKRGRTSALKELRVGRSLTRLWAIILVLTTQFIATKRLTPTLTTNNWTVTRWWPELEFFRTRVEQIGTAANQRALAFTLMWGHSHGDVKAVNEANSVRGEVTLALVETKLS